jgi:hypothetical protein
MKDLIRTINKAVDDYVSVVPLLIRFLPLLLVSKINVFLEYLFPGLWALVRFFLVFLVVVFLILLIAFLFRAVQKPRPPFCV